MDKSSEKKILWWLMGILGSLIVASSATVTGFMFGRIQDQQDRLVRLETYVEFSRIQISEMRQTIDERLIRIDTKLEQLRMGK